MTMYVKVFRNMEGPAAVTEDARGEPVLMLKLGAVVDEAWVANVGELLRDVMTYRAARNRWLMAPHTYHEAATALGVPQRWLASQVHNDPTFPHSKVGTHVAFTGEDLEEIKERFAKGELRHALGRPTSRAKRPPA